jgi:hypothetical protein
MAFRNERGISGRKVLEQGERGRKWVEERVREERCLSGGMDGHCCCSLAISS